MARNTQKTAKKWDGIYVYNGWSATLEITPKYEIWNFGFSKKIPLLDLSHHEICSYQEWKDRVDNNGNIEYIHLKKEEKKPHLFLTNDFIKASSGDFTLKQWTLRYCDESSLNWLYNIAHIINEYLNWLVKTQNTGQLAQYGDRELSELLQNLTIMRFNENYVFTIMENRPESIVPFIALEIFETARLNLQVKKCDSCGYYYVKQTRQRYNLCGNRITCPWPSRAPIATLTEEEKKTRNENILRRVKRHREKKNQEKEIRKVELYNSVKY